MRIAFLALVAALAVAPASAQRAAVSADLSPEAAAQVFGDAVASVCVPAVTGGGVSGLSAAQRGNLQPTNDAETRKQAGAAPDETVWDVMDGKGVVTVREKVGRCVVSVYGPSAKQTIAGMSQTLPSKLGLRVMSGMTNGGIDQTLIFELADKRVAVQLAGSDPGMPGHQSRFSVVTATVFVAQ